MLGDMGHFGVLAKRLILNDELTATEDNTSEMILLVRVSMSAENERCYHEFQRQRFIEMSSSA